MPSKQTKEPQEPTQEHTTPEAPAVLIPDRLVNRIQWDERYEQIVRSVRQHEVAPILRRVVRELHAAGELELTPILNSRDWVRVPMAEEIGHAQSGQPMPGRSRYADVKVRLKNISSKPREFAVFREPIEEGEEGWRPPTSTSQGLEVATRKVRRWVEPDEEFTLPISIACGVLFRHGRDVRGAPWREGPRKKYRFLVEVV
jgi:hypothetical protein